jgi:hypothetical protein
MVMRGMMEGSARAMRVFPAPGGPVMITLCTTNSCFQPVNLAMP